VFVIFDIERMYQRPMKAMLGIGDAGMEAFD
jgi:hypothetical protein